MRRADAGFDDERSYTPPCARSRGASPQASSWWRKYGRGFYTSKFPESIYLESIAAQIEADFDNPELKLSYRTNKQPASVRTDAPKPRWARVFFSG
ncbi:MAG: hypothetical protein ACLPSF_14515, partial [Methylocella sp.]